MNKNIKSHIKDIYIIYKTYVSFISYFFACLKHYTLIKRYTNIILKYSDFIDMFSIRRYVKYMLFTNLDYKSI